MELYLVCSSSLQIDNVVGVWSVSIYSFDWWGPLYSGGCCQHHALHDEGWFLPYLVPHIHKAINLKDIHRKKQRNYVNHQTRDSFLSFTNKSMESFLHKTSWWLFCILTTKKAKTQERHRVKLNYRKLCDNLLWLEENKSHCRFPSHGDPTFSDCWNKLSLVSLLLLQQHLHSTSARHNDFRHDDDNKQRRRKPSEQRRTET
jgi:hypothetical protein